MTIERDDSARKTTANDRGDGSSGGSLGGGQSGGGAYRNQDDHASEDELGGQTGQGYYGGGQMGNRNFGSHSHSAASTRTGEADKDDAKK